MIVYHNEFRQGLLLLHWADTACFLVYKHLSVITSFIFPSTFRPLRVIISFKVYDVPYSEYRCIQVLLSLSTVLKHNGVAVRGADQSSEAMISEVVLGSIVLFFFSIYSLPYQVITITTLSFH